jgi:hypothetical protein
MIEALQADQAVLFCNDLVSRAKHKWYKYSGDPIEVITQQARPSKVCLFVSLETLPKFNPARNSTKELAKLNNPETYKNIVSVL